MFSISRVHYRRPLTLVQAAFLEGEEEREREMDRNGTVSAAAECESLVSNERLECDSPVMWPDQNFFGDFNPLYLSPAPPKWLLHVQKDDPRTVSEFASLTHAQLMEKVRALQNLAYRLGVEEAKEMSRGKCLNVFQVEDSKVQHTNTTS